MVSLPNAGQKEFWEQRYQQSETAWNIEKPHPLLHKLMAQLRQIVAKFPDGKLVQVLVPGAGHAHCAAYWAMQGYETFAIDFAPSAVTLAKKTYEKTPHLQIKQADLFAEPFAAQTFDVVYDRAMLCALPPDMRAKYVASMAKMLKKDGVFAMISFANIDREMGPPWPLTLLELGELLGSEFDLLFAEDYVYEKKKAEQIILGESLSLWMRR